MPDYLSSHTGKQIDDAVDLVGGIETDFAALEHKVDNLDLAVQGKQDALPTPVVNTYLHADGDGELEWASVPDELPTPVANTYLHADGDGDLEWASVPDELPAPVANTYLHADGDGDLEWTSVPDELPSPVVANTYLHADANGDLEWSAVSGGSAVSAVSPSPDNLINKISIDGVEYSVEPFYVSEGSAVTALNTNSPIGVVTAARDYYTYSWGTASTSRKFTNQVIYVIQGNETNNQKSRLVTNIGSKIHDTSAVMATFNSHVSDGTRCEVKIITRDGNNDLLYHDFDHTYIENDVYHIVFSKKFADGTSHIVDISKSDITQSTLPAPSGSPQFGGGFDLEVEVNSDMYAFVYVLGANFECAQDLQHPAKDEPFYGWHTSNEMWSGYTPTTCENVSSFVIKEGAGGAPDSSIITGDVYAYDGTKITAANLNQYLGKILYALSDVSISMTRSD